ncbi:MAG: rhomboid family intramembrane serine protease [Leptospiraceae bacterium]|nr:rhomboid family intramembrane serine protease [Leptospiraceae bacterium]MCP5511426.1 rhomboid family intramembrane serine protease [Leptospiraceae bacterium]
MGNNYQYQIRFGPAFTPIVKALVILNSAIFLLFIILDSMNLSGIKLFFMLDSNKVNQFYIHQLITYSFLHAGFFHLLFNMLTLWMFGSELEALWGRRNFLAFYLFSSLGGGVLTWLVNFFYPQGLVLGASGGVIGVMVAYALIWPNREVLFMLFFPIKIKYVILIILFPMMLFSEKDNIAHIAHLGGALFGLIYFYLHRKYRFDFDSLFNLDDFIRRRKFKMYQEEMNNRLNVKDRVDELLDKISKKGYNSLSRQEKKFLNDASSKYYND